MPPMIRQKKVWKCYWCKTEYIKWAGSCKECGKIGTIEQINLIPEKNEASARQRSLGRRSKNSERTVAKRMVQVDGPDPNFEKIASSTGRVGHITNIRVDAISKSYVTENKNRVLPKWLLDAWLLINQRADDFGKNALLHMDPPNMPRKYVLNGETKKLDTIAMISQTRHEELITKEKDLEQVRIILLSSAKEAEKLALLKRLLGL